MGKRRWMAADTPNLNRFAGAGLYGLVDPIAPERSALTRIQEPACYMGLQPEDASLLKRGTIEAAGAGLELKDGVVAMRANFATAQKDDGQLEITDRRAGRDTTGLKALSEAISKIDLGDGVIARFHSTDQHRGVLVLDGPGLGADVSDTDPGDARLPAMVARCAAHHSYSEFASQKINLWIDRVWQILSCHPANDTRMQNGVLPANIVITRGAGTKASLRNRHHVEGRAVAMVAGCNTVLGLASLFGYERVSNPRFTADIETDLEFKIKTAVEHCERHDLVMVHVKAPDICAHDRDPLSKKLIVEKLDSALGQLHHWNGVLCLSADHTTDSNTGRHTEDPVPSLIVRLSGIPSENSNGLNFGETLCRSGNLKRQISQEFVNRWLAE